MINLGFYSGKHLPNVRLYPTMLDRILEVVALVVWIIMCAAVIYLCFQLPGGDTKSKAIAVAIAGTFGMVTVAYGGYAPVRLFKFPFRVTEQTVMVQVKLAARLSRVMNVALGLMFLSLALIDTEPVWGMSPTGIFELLAMISAGLLGVALLIYYYFAYKYR